MNLGIVTSCYNNYDNFLKDWVNSIINLIEKPNQIIIVQSGMKYKKENFTEAEKLLKLNKINYKILFIKKHKGMGFARNQAVKNCNTEYIMYLDIDDLIKKDALTILKKYYKKADVICGGLEIHFKDKITKEIYLNASYIKCLKGKRVCCSHAVYKKDLWTKFKYPEDKLRSELCNGFIWLGFAKLKAKFLGIEEVLTVYKRRVEGHYFTITKPNKKDWKRKKKNFLKENKK